MINGLTLCKRRAGWPQWISIWFFSVWMGGSTLLANAQEPVTVQEPVTAGLAETSSPRATLYSFIEACNDFKRLVESERHFDRRSAEHRPVIRRVLDCLDMSEIPKFAREDIAGESAICLKEILDRIPIPPADEIPDLEMIEAMGGQEDFNRWHLPGSRISIGRVAEGDQKDEFLFRPGTIARANDYFQEIKDLPYREDGPETSPGLYDWYKSAPGDPVVAQFVDGLPDWFRVESFGGLARWKWVGLIGGIVAAIVVLSLIFCLLAWLVQRWQGKSVILYGITILLPIAAVFVPILLRGFVIHALTIRGATQYAVSFALDVATLLLIVGVVMGLSTRICEFIFATSVVNSKGLNAQFIRILFRIGGFLVSTLVLLEGGQYLGIPVTTLLASAGVGGLAVALAAQHALKNLLGTMMLMADKPFRTGDRIVVGAHDGIVESVGLRSTRVRLLNGHMVTMPNDELANSDIVNVGRRPHIRRVANIRIPFDTPVENIQRAVAKISELLQGHEGMDPKFPPRVYFDEFNSDSFNIRVFYWYAPPDYWDFLAFSQKLNFEICRIFEAEGIRFTAITRISHTPEQAPEGELVDHSSGDPVDSIQVSSGQAAE